MPKRKLVNGLVITDNEQKNEPDLSVILDNLQRQYRNVHMSIIDGDVYIYRALGRKEYRDIVTDSRFDDLDKEEIVCDSCLLYPENVDWDKVKAGVPRELMKQIRKKSYMDSADTLQNLKDYYRSEMYDLDNQITCIIAEAFPQLDIEEIEAWDIEKTVKYLSRAEWILVNLRGLSMKEPEGQYSNPDLNPKEEQYYEEQPSKEKKNTNVDNSTTIRGGQKKDKLTPAKIESRSNDPKPAQKVKDGAMSLAELKRKFPEVDWGNVDSGMQGIKGLEDAPLMDNLSPALRPGWGF